jgi:hypothetical protein
MMEGLESRVLLSAVYGYLPLMGPNGRPFASPGPTGLAPATVSNAYGFNQVSFNGIVGDGTGQTIAIVDAMDQPNIVGDLHAFDVQFGLPDPPSFTRINQTGGSTLPAADAGWGGEISLDVEWIHALAPGANIVLVEANTGDTMHGPGDLMAAVDTARHLTNVSVVSMSWGFDEFATEKTYDNIFTTPNGHIPITFLASSGDSGAYSQGTSVKTVSYPTASPNVVSVGGTFLSLNLTGGYALETAWGAGTDSGLLDYGSGGGISKYETKPSYQKSVTLSATKRTVPDVAFLADPASGVSVYDTFGGDPANPWQTIGGTSLACPMWAAVMSIVDQGRTLQTLNTLDGRSQTLPKLYGLDPSNFHDIVSGSNGYLATVGYDLVTGLGTPIVNKLVPAMVGGTAAVSSSLAIGSVTVVASAVVSGTSVKLTALNVGASMGSVTRVVFFRESNGTPGLQLGADQVIGNGVQNRSSWIISTTTLGFVPGAYTYYAVAYDDVAGTHSDTASAGLAKLTVVMPTIGSVTAAPVKAVVGTKITLNANNVAETAGSVQSVQFYLETNHTAGLQIGSDQLLGAATLKGTSWTLTLDTTTLVAGTYTVYAVATDVGGITSNAVSTTFTLTPKPGAAAKPALLPSVSMYARPLWWLG